MTNFHFITYEINIQIYREDYLALFKKANITLKNTLGFEESTLQKIFCILEKTPETEDFINYTVPRVFGNLGPLPEMRKYVIRKTAETLTIANREKIKAAKHNPEVQFWIENGLIARYNDYFMLNLDEDLNRKKYQILGSLDALLIIIFVLGSFFTNKVALEERINLLVSVNSSYKFSEGKIIITDPKLIHQPKIKKKVCCNTF